MAKDSKGKQQEEKTREGPIEVPTKKTNLTALSIRGIGWLVGAYLFYRSSILAYNLRLRNLDEFGLVLHNRGAVDRLWSVDPQSGSPWTHYRASEYMNVAGLSKYLTWFDHQVWYPMGRPIGTTTYPGVPLSAVATYKALNYMDYNLEPVNSPLSIKKVCCYMPALGGIASAFFAMLLTYEATGAGAAGILAANVMAVIPSYALVSLGGRFDNESVGIPLMIALFYFWCRSVKTDGSWPFGILAGLVYGGLAATWVGYILGVNLIGGHVLVLLLLGQYGDGLYKAYTLFFIVGTAIATQVPIVGLPFVRSMDNAVPLVVFVALQAAKLFPLFMGQKKALQYIAQVSTLGAIATLIIGVLIPSGFITPLSSTANDVLFKNYIRLVTNMLRVPMNMNPLKEEIIKRGSEAQMIQSLGMSWYTAQAGLCLLAFLLIVTRLKGKTSKAGVFVILFSAAAYHLTLKDGRFIYLVGVAAAVLSGAAVGVPLDWGFSPVWRTLYGPTEREYGDKKLAIYNSLPVRLLRLLAVGAGIYYLYPFVVHYFPNDCIGQVLGPASHNGLVWKIGDKAKGSEEQITDLVETYKWMRDMTPKDARVLAMTEYGHLITGIANRVSLVDSVPGNLEHKALVGRILTAPVEEGVTIARHVTDFIMLYVGGQYEEDLGRSIPMARLANEYFPGHCADPDCEMFGVYKGDQAATDMMKNSLLWKLFGRDGHIGRTFVDDEFLQEVFLSRRGLVRILKLKKIDKESREWLKNPRNHLCDPPGSWYCPGQYPPKLRDLFNSSAAARNPEAAAFQKNFAARMELQQERDIPKPNALKLPQGEYLDSCEGCSSKTNFGADSNAKKMLVCTHCQVWGTPPHPSEIDVFECPREIRKENISVIVNNQGILQCAPFENDENIPAGPYQETCGGCKVAEQKHKVTRVRQRMLECIACSKKDGTTAKSSFEVSKCVAPQKIENFEGKLRCSAKKNKEDIPDGPYKDTCSGCSCPDCVLEPLEHRRGILHCTHCRSPNGRELEAFYPLEFCRHCGQGDTCDYGEPTNHEGHIVCTNLPNELGMLTLGMNQAQIRENLGDFVDTCQGCEIIDRDDFPKMIMCTHCMADNHTQVFAHVSADGCREGWNNQNGELKCRIDPRLMNKKLAHNVLPMMDRAPRGAPFGGGGATRSMDPIQNDNRNVIRNDMVPCHFYYLPFIAVCQ